MNDDSLRDQWLAFQRERNCSIDRMLCDPELRQEFLSAMKLSENCRNHEREILWRLVSFRKRRIMPARLR